jgi:superfamily II DNA or RNA helicase
VLFKRAVSSAGESWVAALDLAQVRRLVSRRILDLALASRLLYSRSPKLLEGIVHATLIDHDAASSEPFHVQLTRGDDPAIAHGECSRCAQTFGACLHVAVLAADLGCSSDLRDALTAGRETRELAAHAPERRHAADVEQRFEGALSVWLAPTLAASSAERLVISASPFAEVDAYVGRAYGETVDLTRTRVLSIFVRRAGERKLLSPREILPARRWSPRDRRVLEYSRDRGANRKAVYALGVEASLTVEAMRLHGGVFVEGTRNLLDFRPVMVRPTVSLTRGALGPGFDTLSALWTPDGGEHPVPFADGVLFTGPFPYVWTRDGAIYAVARDVDLDFATELAASSVLHVPSSRLREAGARLLRATRGRGIALPAHERFGLPPVEIPRIVLRLSGEPLDITGELVALYAAREVALLPSDGVGSEDGRDLATESRGLRHIEDAGLVRTGEGPLAPDTPLRASDDDAVDFWQSKLPSLREATDPPVHVQLSERLARVRVGAPIQARVHVVLEGNWLGTRLEFASRDLPVELEAIRVVLARKQRWVALSDGSIARISSAVKSLADEATTVMDGSAGRLPPHQLGRLERWLRENDGTIDTAVESLRGRLRALAVAAEPDMPVGLTATLRPYQRLGLAWLQFLQALGAGGILGDDMGLGKTITTLAYLLRRKELEGAAPSLVVCPTSVVTNWLRESERFTPSLRVALLQGPARARAATDISGSDVIVTTYALLRRDTDALSAVRWRCAVLDEAQNIKNEASATARAANRLDADLRLALSGTPIENRLTELWSLATFANPGILGTVRAFEKRFERPIAGDRQSPLSEELRAVVRPFLLRRTKDEVLKELPPKTEVDRVVTLKPSDKRMYDALAHSLRISVARDIDNRRGLSGLGVFTALTRLRQMACDPRLVDARLAAGAPSAKREAFLEVVRELVAEGRRALVFSQFVELLTLWRRDLDADGIEYAYLDGSTTKRDQVVADFQAGHAPLFLISLKAGGAGLNLTAADTVILCDPWWNPAVEDQATDRAYRIGQDKPVTVVRLIAQGTIEEKVLSLKAKKRELTRAVIGDDAGALSGLTEADVRVLLGDADAPGLIDEPEDSEHRDGLSRTSPTDTLATDDEVLEPAFDALAVQVQWWLASTGRLEAELASLVDIPVPYASRLARGLPFPCSRAVADRIRARLRAW